MKNLITPWDHDTWESDELPCSEALYPSREDCKMDRVVLNGVEYQIVKEVTPESAAAEGQKHLAAYLRAHGIQAEVYLTRPAGSKLYLTCRDDFGRLGSPVPINRS